MSMKVLVIDHDWRFANQVSNYLESHAHLVVHQTRTKEAVSLAGHWQPDLVILSAELAETALPALKNMPDRPAVLLTANLDRFDRAWRAWQTGGDELLMKPVLRTEELHTAIVSAMENAATGRRTGNIAASA
jgi:DNA-binding response OmpR family regulator